MRIVVFIVTFLSLVFGEVEKLEGMLSSGKESLSCQFTLVFFNSKVLLKKCKISCTKPKKTIKIAGYTISDKARIFTLSLTVSKMGKGRLTKATIQEKLQPITLSPPTTSPLEVPTCPSVMSALSILSALSTLVCGETTTTTPTTTAPTTTTPTTTTLTTTTHTTTNPTTTTPTTTTPTTTTPTTSTPTTTTKEPDMLLFLGPGKILQVPSFTLATGCSVPSYPISSLIYAVTGVVDNKIMTCGGYSSGYVAQSSCYKLTGGAWVQQASLATARVYSAASMSGDGLLVTGGSDGSSRLSSTEVLSGSTWQAGPPLKEAVEGHCQIYLQGSVYITGGYTGSSSKRVYSLSGNTWTRLADMKTARGGHSCIVADNQDILVMGGGGEGRSVEMFKPSTNNWTVLTSLPVDMFMGQAGTLSNNIVYCMTRDSDTIYTTNDLTTWTKTVISNFNSGGRGVFPAPLVPSTLINC